MIHIATPDGELRILNDDYDFERLIEEYAGYEAIANKNGAVSSICENGVRLGVKPDEFDFLDREEKERNDKRKMVVQQNHRRELGQ